MASVANLFAQQEVSIHSISRSLDNFKKLGKNNYTIAKIQARERSLKETWTTFVRTHAVLLQAVPVGQRESHVYFRDQYLDQIEETYQGTLDYMADCMEDINLTVRSNQDSQSAGVHNCSGSSLALSNLPPINIPPFTGKYDEWESFRDRFTSLIIQNKDLSNFSRMHFLSSSLIGQALESIRSIPVTADNFELAWAILKSRFENKRRLIELHISAICNLPTVSRESAYELSELRERANRAITSLKNLNRSVEEILSDILVYNVSNKLDPTTRKAWKLKGGDDKHVPSYDELDRFLESRARALEEFTPTNIKTLSRSAKVISTTASVTHSASCPLCKASHFVNKCPQFTKQSPSQRRETIKRTNRCFNCLSAKHTVNACASKHSCRVCHNRHHSMLHLDSVDSVKNDSPTAVSSIPSTNSNSSSDTNKHTSVTALFSTAKLPCRPQILLATARIRVGDPLSNRSCIIRALLDQGSEITFITERLRQLLKLRYVKRPISIAAVGGVDVGTCRYAADINISPVNDSRAVLSTTASVLKNLTRHSPAPVSQPDSWTQFADLTLADTDLTSSDPIDILIGADLYGSVILDGIRRVPGGPIAQNTLFGWVLSGPVTASAARARTIIVQHISSSLSLEQELRRFWEIEEIPRPHSLSPDEQRCEDHFLATRCRDSNGRYRVRLPFKTNPPIPIGDSYHTALRCLNSLNRRLKANAELRAEYVTFLEEYEKLGHIKRVKPVAGISPQYVYIPHHSVIRESSSTTHLRVVFNASSRTTNVTSLNDHLLSGPKLQTDLATILLRWRQFQYVYSADVAKMYRQIFLDNRDVDYQRILWLNPDADSPQEYQHLTVTYGTASAPFLALRVIKQLVRDEGDSFPLAVPVLTENIYVNDVLFGADDIPLLRQRRDQLCALLRRAQFEIRKWSSNSSTLLNDIDVTNHGLACNKILQADEQLKILGISCVRATSIARIV